MRRWRNRFTPLLSADLVVVAIVLLVTVWALHPTALLSNTTITGGDTGAHVALGAYLKTQWWSGSLTPWYPGWFAGFPLYTYYFVVPDGFAALASYVIPYAVAFKLATILGSLLLPIAAYTLGRCCKAPRPVPAAMAAATLPFLFDVTFTIDGGNLFSTMAGEYSFSLSLSFALLAIASYARALESRRGRWVPAVLLALTLAAHVLPFFFAVVGIGLLWLLDVVQHREGSVRRDRRRATWFTLTTGLLGAGLWAWWLLPFVTEQGYTNSMGYTNNDVSSMSAIFAHLGWFCQPGLDGCPATGGPGADRVVIVLAGLALLRAFYVRSRLGMFLTLSTVVWIAAYVLDPQSAIWNERLVPFWYISVYLAAGWLVGSLASAALDALATRRRRRVEDRLVRDAGDEEIDWHTLRGERDEIVSLHRERGTFFATLAVGLLAALVTLPPMIPWLSSALGVTPGPNEVPNWAAWNYGGYENKPAWPELHQLIVTMEHETATHGCGRAMWEYAGGGKYGDESRFGTTMALMLLPYWTNQCVGSMEGLLFESSATTPYHFLNQAELSAYPSDPMVGLAYSSLNVAQGVQHLQMMGVKYYLAFSPTAVAAANVDPNLTPLVTLPALASVSGSVPWHIYLVKDAPLVQGLTALPNVVAGIASKSAWLNANTSWWQTPSAWPVLLAADGPPSWPRVAATTAAVLRHAPPVTIRHLVVGAQSLAFDVSRTGTPVLVKTSYFPRWHVSGALGPFRVSPNEMAVVPTSTHVSLTYGSTPWLTVGNFITDCCVLAGLVALWRRRPWRRPRV